MTDTTTKATEGILTIQDLNHQAKCIANAIADLMHADYALDADSIHSDDMDIQLEVREVLRTHSTCSGMLETLVFLCDNIEKALDSVENDIMNAARTERAERGRRS